MVELNVYKNTDSTSAQYGKAYCRVDYKETFDVSKLAKHMIQKSMRLISLTYTMPLMNKKN